MQVTELPIEQLVANSSNPNEMDDRTFNALCLSIQEEGWTEPIQVVQIDHDRYEIVGGHHRVQAATVLGIEKVPAVLLDPEKFDQDRRDWNLVKLNVLRGQLNPIKFTELYNRMKDKYDAEVLQSLMGFTSEDAFKRMYQEVKRALPRELQEALAEVREEIKTIDDLSLVLNKLFREYGETLPSNMMVFSWGGREVLWIRANDKLWKLAKRLADDVAEQGGDVAEAFAERLSAQLVSS